MIGLNDANEPAIRYKSGDAGALEELHKLLEPIIYTGIGHVGLYGRPEHVTADDVRQQSWLILGELARRWEPTGSFLVYFHASFEPTIRRWLGRERGCDAKGMRRNFSVEHDDLCGRIDRYTGYRDGDALPLQEWLAPLTDAERRAVVLGVLDGYTYEAMAPTLGVSRATAHRLCTRGLDRLRATVDVAV